MNIKFSLHPSDTSRSFRISYFRHKLLPILLLIITLFLILSSVICNIVERTISNKLNSDSVVLLSQTKRSFESVMNEIYALTLILTYDTSTVENIENCLNSTRIHYSDIQNIQNSVVIPLVATRDYIESIYIYFDNPNGLFIASTDGLASLDSYSDTSWYNSISTSDALCKRIWSESRTYRNHAISWYQHHVVTVYQRNLYQDGIVVLNLNQEYFNQQLNYMCNYEGQMIYVLDEQGDILFSTTHNDTLDSGQLKEMLAHNDSQSSQSEYFLSSAESDFVPKWTFVSIVPKGSLYAPIHQIMLLIVAAMIIACIIVVILTTIKVWQSYQSINRIVNFIEEIKKDPYTRRLNKKPKEYEFIVESLVEAYTRKYALNQELLENKYTAKVLELKSLQSQINPHFLLNTLQSIFWASFQLTNGYNSVSKMIEDLNTILEYLLESEHILVPIEKEIRNLKSYISIQQMRTHNKFEMQWDIPEEFYSCYTGKLLFQPILENSILHGFKGPGHWMIRFHIRRQSELMVVKITDNGKGMSKSQLANVRSKLVPSAPVPSSHIGIYNSNRRLQLLFGNQYHITVYSKENMGTQICLYLPLITNDNKQNYL